MDKTYHFSAPGRTEIDGNHTDHQHGCVPAAEVTLNGTNVIRVDSEGYKPVEIDHGGLTVKESEKNHGRADSRRGGGVCGADRPHSEWAVCKQQGFGH